MFIVPRWVVAIIFIIYVGLMMYTFTIEKKNIDRKYEIESKNIDRKYEIELKNIDKKLKMDLEKIGKKYEEKRKQIELEFKIDDLKNIIKQRKDENEAFRQNEDKDEEKDEDKDKEKDKEKTNNSSAVQNNVNPSKNRTVLPISKIIIDKDTLATQTNKTEENKNEKTKSEKYGFDIQEPLFSFIDLKLKTVEVRKNSKAQKRLKVGDAIEWRNNDYKLRKILTRITKITEYKTVREYLETDKDSKCFFGIYDEEDKINYFYSKICTKEDEEKYGVIAIEFELINSNNKIKNNI